MVQEIWRFVQKSAETQSTSPRWTIGPSGFTQGKAPYERIDRDVARRYELISRIGRGSDSSVISRELKKSVLLSKWRIHQFTSTKNLHPFFIHGIHFWYEFEIPPEFFFLEPRYYREKEVFFWVLKFTSPFITIVTPRCYGVVFEVMLRDPLEFPLEPGKVKFFGPAVSAWQDPNKFEKYAMKKAAGWGNWRHIMITYILLDVIYIYIY